MQPYLFPYLGYFQLINAVDVFVILDDVQYIKQGWINRNQILVHHESKMFTLPVKKDSFAKYINERYYNDAIFDTNKKNILDLVYHAYKRAPYYSDVIKLIHEVFDHSNLNVADFNTHSLSLVCDYLGIDTRFVIASRMARSRDLNREDAVIDMNRLVGAECCITPIGGKQLYSKNDFRRQGVDLTFLEMNDITYPQFGQRFVSSLSIIDVMMFNSQERIGELLQCYTLS
jgi:hypothetical protein